MSKYFQREFLLPPLTVIAVAVAQFMGYELTMEQKIIVGGMCATALSGIILRRSILGPTAGLAKFADREWWLPIMGELIPFADRIFNLGMSLETQLWLAGGIATMVAALLGRKQANAHRMERLRK